MGGGGGGGLNDGLMGYTSYHSAQLPADFGGGVEETLETIACAEQEFFISFQHHFAKHIY